MPRPVASALRPVAAALAPVILLAVALAGCASSGGTDYTIEQGEIASRALPSTREVSHDPDSLVHLDIVEKDGQLDFQLDGSYQEMLLEWTAGQRGLSQRSYFQTHATLWSRELSLASLMPELGISTLSDELAREKIAERNAEVDSLLQIDVYVFAPSLRRLDLGDLQLDSAGQRVYLRDQEDNQYEPVRIESDAPLEAFHAGHRTLYGRNAVYFDRYSETGDDLFDAEELRLYVRPAGYYFTWTLPSSNAVASSTGER